MKFCSNDRIKHQVTLRKNRGARQHFADSISLGYVYAVKKKLIYYYKKIDFFTSFDPAYTRMNECKNY